MATDNVVDNDEMSKSFFWTEVILASLSYLIKPIPSRHFGLQKFKHGCHLVLRKEETSASVHIFKESARRKCPVSNGMRTHYF